MTVRVKRSKLRGVGLSTRRVHELFGSEPASLMRWIWQERLQRCRAEPGGTNVRAVMLTADSRLVTLQRAIALGFDEFLPKPILDQAEFLQRIDEVMTRRQ